MNRTLSQQRAKFALDKVKSIYDQKDPKLNEDYSNFCLRLPGMILNNGLGQTLAFLLADAQGDRDRASFKLYEQLSEWVITNRGIYHQNSYGKDGLMRALMEGDRGAYIRAQTEVLELLGWMRRFSDAYIGRSESQP